MGIEYKITGVLQLIAVSIIAIYLYFNMFSKSIALFSVAFFAIKGIAFAVMKRNPLSALDAIAGLYLLFPVVGWFENAVLNIIFIGFLLQKGIFYLFR